MIVNLIVNKDILILKLLNKLIFL